MMLRKDDGHLYWCFRLLLHHMNERDSEAREGDSGGFQRSYGTMLKVVCNVSLSAFNFGYINGNFNSIDFDDIVRIFGLEQYPHAFMHGLLTGCLSLTGGIGALLSSCFLKRFSRRQCYNIIGISTMIISIMILSGHILTLFLGRLFQGILIGITSTLNPLYIRQFVPTGLVSKLCPLHQLFIIAGVSYTFFQTYILSLILPVEIYWRIVFGFPIITSGIMLYNIQKNYPYDTPKWLLLNKRDQQAVQLLKVIYKQQYVGIVYDEIKNAIEEQKKRQTDSIKQIQMEEISENLISKEKIQRPKRQRKQTTRIELTNNRLAVIAAITLSFNQQIVGMGIIIAYSGELVKFCFPGLSKIFPVFINLIALAGVFTSIPILKAFGRKKSIQCGNILIIISLFCVARTFGQLNFEQLENNPHFLKIMMLVFLLIIRLLYSMTLGPFILVYIPQIVQAQLLPDIIFVNWVTVSSINFIFPIQLQLLQGNPSHIFDGYCMMTFLCYLINRQAMIQTTDKTEIQIRRQYDNKYS